MSFHDPQHADLPIIEDEPFPGWQVVSFVDPAGTGSDLAFTEGLSAFELPELLLWARPTEGLDPGADWLLTHRERSRLLNRWALELMSGSLQSGEEREERFDGGHTVARFRFGQPRLVSAASHPYLPAGSPVISMAWSLLRRAPAVLPPAHLSPAMTRRMQRWISAAEAVTFDRGLRPGTLDEAAVSTLPAQLAALSIGRPGEQRFGLMTPWVEARIAQILAADAETVGAFLSRVRLARCGRCEDCFLDDLFRLATRSHRNGECREASRSAQDLALALAGPPGEPTALWQAVAAFSPIGFEGGPGPEEGLRTVLSDGLELLLISAVLADVSTPAQLASGSGPWEWAVHEQRLPGRLWLARPAVRQATRQLLASATPDQLAEAAEQARRWATLPECRTVSRLIGGLQTTAAASAQQGALLRRDQRRGLPRPIIRTADQLAGQLLTAMALPHRFPDDCWDLLRRSLFPIAPGLPADLPAEVP